MEGCKLLKVASSLVDALPFPIYICDNQLVITHANPPAHKHVDELDTISLKVGDVNTEDGNFTEANNSLDLAKGVVNNIPLTCFICDTDIQSVIFTNKFGRDAIRKQQSVQVNVDGSPLPMSFEDIAKSILSVLPYPILMLDQELKEVIHVNDATKDAMFCNDKEKISVTHHSKKAKKTLRKHSGHKEHKKKIPQLKLFSSNVKKSKTSSASPSPPSSPSSPNRDNSCFGHNDINEFASVVLRKSPRCSPKELSPVNSPRINERVTNRPLTIRPTVSFGKMLAAEKSASPNKVTRRSISFESQDIKACSGNSSVKLGSPPRPASPTNDDLRQVRELLNGWTDGSLLIGNITDYWYSVSKVVHVGPVHCVLLAECLETESTVMAKTLTRAQQPNTKQEESDQVLNSLEYEAKQMRNLDHPNLVKLLDVAHPVQDAHQCRPFWLITEHCHFGSVYDLSTRLGASDYFSEAVIVNILYDTLQGLKYIHTNRIIHRDIKAANLFIHHDGTVKIGDFGTTRPTLNTRDTVVGTSYWMAPVSVQ